MHFSFTDIFPDINRLLRIAYNYLQRARKKYSFELKLVKGYLRTTMTTERL